MSVPSGILSITFLYYLALRKHKTDCREGVCCDRVHAEVFSGWHPSLSWQIAAYCALQVGFYSLCLRASWIVCCRH